MSHNIKALGTTVIPRAVVHDQGRGPYELGKQGVLLNNEEP